MQRNKAFKVFIKRNFLAQLFDCIGKISQNHNIISLIEFLQLSYFLGYSILFHMKITQPVTLLCIIAFQESFFGLKSTQNITLQYLGLDGKHSLHTCKCSFAFLFHYYMLQIKQPNEHSLYSMTSAGVDFLGGGCRGCAPLRKIQKWYICVLYVIIIITDLT